MNNSNKRYQQCILSVMDTISDPDIQFDENGVCNYYYEYKAAEENLVYKGNEGEQKLENIIKKIKKEGEGKAYDCIIGMSGGVDSSYVAYIAKQKGLRPLAVHFDNGWNSELAVKNIESMVNKLGFDLYTLVVDWEEFKDLQLAYLKASVIDIEAATDHAISGTIARLCKQHKIKYSLSGTNVVTEFTMPPSWIFNKNDHINLKAIHKKFGTMPLKTYPLFNSYLKRYLNNILNAESVPILNYLPYNKEEVKALISKELGWRDYGGKHYESIFTKFYQAYILPEKFKVDKRKAHLSTMIFSGQISKDQALLELSNPLYREEEFKTDYEFVLKKFGLTHDQFQQFLHQPRVEHSAFPIEQSIYNQYRFLKPLEKLKKKLQNRR